jgi:hypothetical protein
VAVYSLVAGILGMNLPFTWNNALSSQMGNHFIPLSIEQAFCKMIKPPCLIYFMLTYTLFLPPYGKINYDLVLTEDLGWVSGHGDQY